VTSDRRRLGRIAGAAALTMALAATAAYAVTTAHWAATGRPHAVGFSSGAISLTNSRAPRAIFSASNLVPGGSATGTVTVRNAGTAAGSLALSPARSETSGAGGRALLASLWLRVADVTGGADTVVYHGRLPALPRLRLRTLKPGAARAYRFSASLPDTGSSADGVGDNLLQRASIRVAYDWTLTQGARAPSPAERRCIRRLRGTARGDRLIGTAGGDRIYGRGGADRIDGRGGADCVWGGTGADIVLARDGRRDWIDCGPGRDRAVVDRVDRVVHCERVLRPARRR
jgi:Ca2+-binding RTX toxin-like protein